jgi:hypothetical protein
MVVTLLGKDTVILVAIAFGGIACCLVPDEQLAAWFCLPDRYQPLDVCSRRIDNRAAGIDHRELSIYQGSNYVSGKEFASGMSCRFKG